MEKFKLEREKCQENKIKTYRNQKDEIGKGTFMYCIKCGNEIPNEARFCQKCGAPINGENPIHGGTEVNSKRKGKKVMPVLIIVGLITIAVIGITMITNGTSSGLENTMQESPTSLLSQIENKYGIEIPEIQATSDSAVGNVVLEDYLPYEGYRRFTSIVNTQTGEENTVEEMTMYVQDGITGYNLYSNLTNTTTQGVLELDESGEYYYTVQENLLIAGETDTDVYIGLPEKTWTIPKNEETVQIFIAPEYYTATTPHGTYENCLLKYEEYSGGQIMFSAYAPNGVGKVIGISWWNPTENTEESQYYYTYNPDDISVTENSDIADMPDEEMITADNLDNKGDGNSTVTVLSPEIQTIFDNSTQYNSDNGYILAMHVGTTDLWVIDPNANSIIYHGNIGTQKYRDGWPVIGDTTIGCEDEVLNFYDKEDGKKQISLSLFGTLYNFTEGNSSLIKELLEDEGAEFWTNGNGTDSYMLTMRIEEDGTHLYMFNPSTYEMPYSGLIFDELKQENSVMGDAGCPEGKLVFISDGELELTVGTDSYIFYKN